MVYEKNTKGLPPLNISKPSKISQEKEGEIKKNYMNIISGGMIVDSNYTGTSFNRWIQKLSPKGINPIQFLQKRFF